MQSDRGSSSGSIRSRDRKSFDSSSGRRRFSRIAPDVHIDQLEASADVTLAERWAAVRLRRARARRARLDAAARLARRHPRQWESAQWQRAHCVKNVKQLRAVLGDLLDERFYADLARPGAFATMSMLVPPQMLNTMVPPARRPARRRSTPTRSGATCSRSPPTAHRMAVAPVRHARLAARARHVGRRGPDPPLPDQGARRAAVDLPAVLRPLHPDGPGRQLHPAGRQVKLTLKPVDRYDAHIAYLRAHPGVRDVVVSGGDVANVPWKQFEAFLMRLLEIETIRDIRLATKALVGLPQHWLQPDVVEGWTGSPHRRAAAASTSPIHTHVNHASRSPRWSPGPRGRCSTSACATCATRAC